MTLADGALTVASTGVAYSHIAGRIDLQPDRVHVDQITVLDNHDSALSFTGDLAVHAREVGDFHLWITADDFKVVDNKLGNLRVQSALELVGELRSPEIRGDFGVSTGRLDLDEIMAQIPSAYSTEAIGDPNTTAVAGRRRPAGEPFDLRCAADERPDYRAGRSDRELEWHRSARCPDRFGRLERDARRRSDRHQGPGGNPCA